MKFARRMLSQPNKAFGRTPELILEMERKGIDIIKMAVGSPSFDTPINIKEATKRALDQGLVHYDEIAGLREFRYAISQKLSKSNNIKTDPDSQVLVTAGLTQGAFAAIMALIDEGDEVISFDPGYPSHYKRVEFAGGKIRCVELGKEDGYTVRREAVESVVTDKTRAILWVNPHNPLGRVFSRPELEVISSVAKENDLTVISDETYEFFTYDQRKHVSIASLDGMGERTVSLFTFTKAYAMDGWRLGYAAGPPEVIHEMKKVTAAELTHVNVFIQKGGVEAILGDQTSLLEMVDEDRRRRDRAVRLLNEMEGVSCQNPEGSIYVFPDFGSYGLDSDKLEEIFLEKGHVASLSGNSYGRLGAGHIRFCFGSVPEDRLVEGLERVKKVLRERV